MRFRYFCLLLSQLWLIGSYCNTGGDGWMILMSALWLCAGVFFPDANGEWRD